MNPFDFLGFGPGDMIENDAIKNTAGSAYQLFMAIGVIGIMVSLVIAGVTIGLSAPQKRAEAIDGLKWKLLVAMVLFGMSAVLGIVMNIVASFG